MKQNKFNLFRKPKTEGYKVTAIAPPQQGDNATKVQSGDSACR